jgi:chromate transporter
VPLVLRASTLHMGGTATQSWLRARTVGAGLITEDDFNRCFAVARLTPGTNLLAFYAALGHVLARWRGAAVCLAIASFVPALIAGVLGVLYVRVAGTPLVDRFMAGAQAGAVAVLVWTAAQLLLATARTRLLSGLVVGALTLAAAMSGQVPPVLILLTAAGASALVRTKAT